MANETAGVGTGGKPYVQGGKPRDPMQRLNGANILRQIGESALQAATQCDNADIQFHSRGRECISKVLTIALDAAEPLMPYERPASEPSKPPIDGESRP